MPVRTTDKSPKGFGINKVLDSHSVEFLSTQRIGGGTNPNPGVVGGSILYLDAGNTASYPGSGTTWYDLSGNGNNATLVNGVSFDGGNGGSLSFDGSNDYVSNTLSNPGSLPILFDFWINSNTSTPVGIFDSAPNQQYVLRNYDPGQVEWWSDNPQVDLNITASTWTNITIQYSFSVSTLNRIITYYKNGTLISTTTGTTPSNYGWSSLVFGNINGGSGGSYSGKISIIKIYNRALSASEVLQNFNADRGRFGI
jgi:hypothetical protein